MHDGCVINGSYLISGVRRTTVTSMQQNLEEHLSVLETHHKLESGLITQPLTTVAQDLTQSQQLEVVGSA